MNDPVLLKKSTVVGSAVDFRWNLKMRCGVINALPDVHMPSPNGYPEIVFMMPHP
jgi:hypothetical protein